MQRTLAKAIFTITFLGFALIVLVIFLADHLTTRQR